MKSGTSCLHGAQAGQAQHDLPLSVPSTFDLRPRCHWRTEPEAVSVSENSVSVRTGRNRGRSRFLGSFFSHLEPQPVRRASPDPRPVDSGPSSVAPFRGRPSAGKGSAARPGAPRGSLAPRPPGASLGSGAVSAASAQTLPSRGARRPPAQVLPSVKYLVKGRTRNTLKYILKRTKEKTNRGQ